MYRDGGGSSRDLGAAAMRLETAWVTGVGGGGDGAGSRGVSEVE